MNPDDSASEIGEIEGRLDPGFRARYQLDTLLGKGGMGVVYRALDLQASRPVAIKFMSGGLFEGDDTRRRFHNEAGALEGLRHPNLVEVLHSGETQGQPFIVFEFVQGRTLKELLRSQGALPVYRSLDILAGILQGLEVAHSRGIIHRDIKSENILLDPQGRPRVADFGIAKSDEAAQTRTGVIIGTPAYMAPEQATGKKLDPRADLYSTGVVLFEMLTGQLPFGEENSMTTMMAHINQPVPAPTFLVEGLPELLDDLVAGALAKAPEQRYPSAQGFRIAVEKTVARLRQVGYGSTGAARPPPPSPPEAEPPPDATRAVHLGTSSLVGSEGAASPGGDAGATTVVDRRGRAATPRVLERTRAQPAASAPVPRATAAPSPRPGLPSWVPALGGLLALVLLGGGWLLLGRGQSPDTRASAALQEPRAQVLRDRLEQLADPELPPTVRTYQLDELPSKVPEGDQALRDATLSRLAEIEESLLLEEVGIRAFRRTRLALGERHHARDLIEEAAERDQEELRRAALEALDRSLDWPPPPGPEETLELQESVWLLDRLGQASSEESALFLSLLVRLVDPHCVERLGELIRTGQRQTLPPETQSQVVQALIRISGGEGDAARAAHTLMIDRRIGSSGGASTSLDDSEFLDSIRKTGQFRKVEP